MKLRVLWLGIAVVLALSVAGLRPAHAGFSGTLTGTLPSGAAYLIEVPADWNGTLAVYSHRYPTTVGVVLDSPSFTSRPVSDPTTHDWLLSHRYALAGTSYRATGWALQEAFEDRIAVIDEFEKQVGPPTRTIAWGQSLGGLVTAGLVQLHPERFAGALPMCGPLAGGIANLNMWLDGAFVFQTLIDPSLEIVNIASPSGAFDQAFFDLYSAQFTPEGRARIALALAMQSSPGWFDSPTRPPRKDYAAQQLAQFSWAREINLAAWTVIRAELETRAGGNPSWNTGVDYRAQLRRSGKFKEVVALYELAGLSLDDDLATLAAAPRIAADPQAEHYLNDHISFDGQLGGVPVLAMHLIGDGNVVVENERAYKDAVHAAGDGRLLRQVYIERPGHCSFTAAETIAAFQTLVRRIDTGNWGKLGPRALNGEAEALDLGPSAFARFRPKAFLRPFPD